VIPVATNEIFQTICEGGNLLYSGDMIEEAGIYEYTLTSVNGCDSIVTLNVETQTPRTDTLHIQKLPGETYSIGNTRFRNEGVLTDGETCFIQAINGMGDLIMNWSIQVSIFTLLSLSIIMTKN